jgi:phytoene desaturase
LKDIVIIGSGFAGLSAACFLAKQGNKVVVIEKNAEVGGRARQLKIEGFTFDMGPSWYWMPDVFERFFACFNKKVSDYYTLDRLDPSYRVYWPDSQMDIPAQFEKLCALFESYEAGAAKNLQKFVAEAAYKYNVGINKLVFKPGQSLTEFLDADVIKGVFKLDILSNMKTHVAKYFKHSQLQQLLEFPVLFLGALPQNIPALYSLMNYADIKLGTWYPQGGMHQIVKAMHSLATELGVTFFTNATATEISITNNLAKHVVVNQNGIVKKYFADVVVSGADYAFTENKLLPKPFANYTDSYWSKRVMAPSCLLYYVGINKKLKNILHHTLFFDTDFGVHGNEIYANPKWPTAPLFYVSATSVTDATVAPEGCENLFFLIPIAAGLTGDDVTTRDIYFEKILTRFEQRIGENIKEHIVVKQAYGTTNFIADYNSFKGNAYGLANTLMQTAILKPALKNKKIKNLFYTGQLTVPGPGVPPSLISGEVVAKEIQKHYN